MGLTLEDLDAKLVCELLGFLVDGNVEAEDDGQLLRLLQHRRCPHDILAMHRSNVDTRDLHS